jgi:hypothetical protein
VFPAKSVQGKDPWGLAEVRGQVFGGKGGRGELGEDDHLLGLLWFRLSPSLASARERRDSALALGERCGGEEWCEGESGSGWGLL